MRHDLPKSQEYELWDKEKKHGVAVSFAAKSERAGTRSKPNQDSYNVVVNMEAVVPHLFLMVCDGHGKTGHIASQVAVEMLGCTCPFDPLKEQDDDMLAWQERRYASETEQMSGAVDQPNQEDADYYQLLAAVRLRIAEV